MKIHLSNPPDTIWQTIVNNRIDKLSLEFQEKKERAENALGQFIQQYKLEAPTTQEFVEFINYNLNNFDDAYYSFMAEKQCKIALGIKYENDLISIFKKQGSLNIPENIRSAIKTGMTKIKENVKMIDIKVIFNAELIKELLLSNDYKLIAKYIESFDFNFKSLDAHVTHDDFINFSLTDNELIQPSFDPTNKLIGSYISRNKNIYQIFHDKFNELYAKGISFSQFISEQDEIQIDDITKPQIFALCLL
jgi:translation elongation factor EF-G